METAQASCQRIFTPKDVLENIVLVFIQQPFILIDRSNGTPAANAVDLLAGDDSDRSCLRQAGTSAQGFFTSRSSHLALQQVK